MRWKSTRLPIFVHSHLTNDCLELGRCTKFIAVRVPKDITGSYGIDCDFVVGAECKEQERLVRKPSPGVRASLPVLQTCEAGAIISARIFDRPNPFDDRRIGRAQAQVGDQQRQVVMRMRKPSFRTLPSRM